MKKTNLLKGAMSILAASVLLASCTQLDSRIDTVDTLETPSVKAVAYPGMNVITWDSVKGALKYKVTRVIDGVEEVLEEDVSVCYHADVYPSDKVEVEYRVYALSKANPSKAVFVYDSKAGSTKVETIFPPAGTKSIDLPKYEKDSGYNFEDETKNKEWKDEFIPTKENIKVELVDDNIVITAPQKAYLDTKFMFDDGTKNEIFGWDDSYEDVMDSLYRQNKKWSLKKKITKAGEVKVGVSVKATSSKKDKTFYKQTDFDLDPITIPAVKTSKPTDNITVKYIDDAQTIARVQFEPAVSLDGKEVFAVTDYKVYRAVNGTSNLEEVKGLKKDSITINGKTTVVYVVDDTVPANNVAYDYYVVLSKDKEFESGNRTAYLPEASINTTDGGSVWGLEFVEFDDDKNRNDVVVKVNPKSGNKIVSVAYAFSTSNDSNKVLDSEYKEENYFKVEPTIADKQQAFLIKDVPENNYVFVKAEFAEIKSTGKANNVVVSVSGKYTIGQANEVHLQISEPTQSDKDLLNDDWIGNLLKVNGGELVSLKYATNKDPNLAKVAAVTGTEIKFKVNDYDPSKLWWCYEFDIKNAGKVGEYLAIAAEVKAKEGNAENYIKVQESESPVSVSDDLPINISYGWDPASTGTKVTRTLEVRLNKKIYKATNNIKNYDSVEISYIATNDKYQIDEKAEWKTLESIKVNSFESDPNVEYDLIHKDVTIAQQTFDSAEANTEVKDYYVIKVVPKYNVPGAKEEPIHLFAELPYMIKK